MAENMNNEEVKKVVKKAEKTEYPVLVSQYFSTRGITEDNAFIGINAGFLKTPAEWETLHKAFKKMSMKDIKALEQKNKKDKRK